MSERSRLPIPDRQPSNPSPALEELKCDLAAQTLRASGNLCLRVTGASMLPTIWPGDILHVQRARPNDLATGDVVLFARNGGLVAHRVVEIRETGHGPQDGRDGARDTGNGAEEMGSTRDTQPSGQWREGSQQPVHDSHRQELSTSVSRPLFPVSRGPYPVLLITRGDRHTEADAPVKEDALLGRVVAIERRGRRVSTRLTPWRRAAAVVLCRSEFCTRVALWLHRRYREQRDQ